MKVPKYLFIYFLRRYEEDMYWRRMEEEQHHWDDRRRMPDGGYPQGPPGPPGLLGVRPGMPIPQPQGPVVRHENSSNPVWFTSLQSFKDNACYKIFQLKCLFTRIVKTVV